MLLLFAVIVFPDQRERKEKDQCHAYPLGEHIVMHLCFEPRHHQKQTIAQPDGIDGVRLNVLNAGDEKRLHVDFWILKNHEEQTHPDESG